MSDHEYRRPPLSAEILEWIQRIRELSATLPDLESPEPGARRRAQRELSDLLAVEFTEAVPAGVLIDDLVVAGGTGPLRARRFRPGSSTGALPTMLWLHGGGWSGGTIDERLNERLCADRSLRSAVQIIALEYGWRPSIPSRLRSTTPSPHSLTSGSAPTSWRSTRTDSASAATPPARR